MTNPSAPLISVCITTYNHEKFIAQALDSVLMQRGHFTLEILVGEDGSTDGTANIVRDYAQRHPDVIRAFFHNPADKLFINGRQTGRKNFMNNLVSARGDYIALLDGDDYWLDERKLEKQLTFLAANPAFVACCHAAIHVDENDVVQEGYMGHHDVKGGARDFTLRDVLQKNPVPTLSVLFRNPRLAQYPDLFNKTDMADWPLHMLNALQGDIHYMDEKMAAYRLHNAGVWADFRANIEKVLRSEIAVWTLLLDEPAFAAHAGHIKTCIEKQYGKLVKTSLRNHAYSAAWHYWRCQKPASIALALRIARKQFMHQLMPGKAKKS
ncbi:MAG TPA: glycosyltransferase [Pseudomonadales bacterium]|nr:glycosyltransferase [Pseudomonadales bacterium]